ncbi:rhomboid family intramembrane serine protease [Candidatus Pacearchaeota archaeon]|nr:rhomboid family intramembrane serine protease [Candidatus Pacearchaeota archaeon]
MNSHNYSRRKPALSERIAKFSVVTWLIILSVVFSLFTFILIRISEDYINYLALKPENIMQGKYLWTILSHMFAHGSPAHLLINMFVLFSLGGLCEKIIGRKRFVWFYLSAGLFAGLISVLLSYYFGSSELGSRIFGAPDVFMVGASGAIFAIAGLYVTLLPKIKFMILFLPFFSLPAYIMVPLVMITMWILSIVFNWPIGNVAHFGGFLVGFLYGLYLKIKYRKKVARLQKFFR